MAGNTRIKGKDTAEPWKKPQIAGLLSIPAKEGATINGVVPTRY